MSKLNYLLIDKGNSQVYGAASKDVILKTPLPTNASIEDRVILFVSYESDTGQLIVRPLPREEIIVKQKEGQSG